jgi:death on curing protein
MSPPEFLTIDEVIEMHGIQLERWGGGEGVRDRGLLESAVLQPQAGSGDEYFYEDIFTMAAVYAHGISQGQPFVDGNKRTGVDAALTFLALNGFPVEDPGMALYEAMIEIAERKLTKEQLASLLRELAAV